jgi:CRP/FNR family transcriptional regulator
MELLDYYCFHNLTKHEEKKILDSAKKVILPSEHILYYTNDICKDVLFLKSGTVKVYIQPQEVGKEELTLYELRKGSQCVVNLFSTISSSSALATAQTITPIQGWLIPKDIILWLINNSESFRDFKIQTVNTRITALVNLLSSIKFSNIEQQLLNWLYVQGLNTIKITHEKIASIIGVTRETISRNLKKLEQKGYIRLNRGMISLVAV